MGMKITRIVALLLLIVSSVAAAPGAGMVLVGYPTDATDPATLRQFELLGGTSGAGQWIKGDQLEIRPAGYTLYNLAGKAGAVRGGGKTSYGVPCEQTHGIDISPVPNRSDWWMAISAPWNPRPRAVTVLPNSSAVYVGIVRDFLMKTGLKNPIVKLERVVRVDLDGDNSDEIVIAANHFAASQGRFPPVNGQAGDYGLLIVRKLVAGKVQTFELGTDVILKATTEAELEQGTQNNPDSFDLVNVLDLNGDRKMEVVMFNAIYEDSAVSAMEWNGKKFVQRLVSGCGV